MYRTYAIRPTWEYKRAALAIAKCYGGGTSSNPSIPPEFAPLINASVRNMVRQQGLNPIDQYNYGNPMGTESFSPGEQLGMSAVAGGLQESPLNYLALQAAQRAAGMAGAGPTTGSYDPTGEMGLQDWAGFTDPYWGAGGEMGNNPNPENLQWASQGSNVDPVAGQGTNYSGGPPIIGGPPSGQPGSTGGSNPGAGMGGAGGGVTAGGQQFGPQIHGLPGQGPGGPDPTGAGFHAQGTGPAWTNSEDFSMDTANGTATNPFLDVMSRGVPWLEHTYGNTYDPNQGMADYAGLHYTGANHEIGGNPAIAQHFAANGGTPEDLAHWLIQNSEAQRAYSTNPQNIQQHLAQGQDVWGNAMPHPQTNFMNNLAAKRQANGMGNAGMMGANPGAGTAQAAPQAAQKMAPTLSQQANTKPATKPVGPR